MEFQLVQQRELMSSSQREGERSQRTHHVVEVNEGVVDGNDISLAVLNGCTEDNATNATEAEREREQSVTVSATPFIALTLQVAISVRVSRRTLEARRCLA